MNEPQLGFRFLTLVAQPCNDIGKQAANLLIERIEAPEAARRTLRPALLLRWVNRVERQHE
jgi:DNA-binding LacI/PurR family transcriptional regulator